jgi:hypothetical protein
MGAKLFSNREVMLKKYSLVVLFSLWTRSDSARVFASCFMATTSEPFGAQAGREYTSHTTGTFLPRQQLQKFS